MLDVGARVNEKELILRSSGRQSIDTGLEGSVRSINLTILIDNNGTRRGPNSKVGRAPGRQKWACRDAAQPRSRQGNNRKGTHDWKFLLDILDLNILAIKMGSSRLNGHANKRDAFMLLYLFKK